MSEHADRLELRASRTPDGKDRWSVVWRNQDRRDLFLLNFHPLVPDETAQAVLEALKASPELLRILK